MKLTDVKDVAILAAVAIGGYYIYKAVGQVPKAYNAAVEATTDALWAVFGPSEKTVMGETVFFIVNFSNGRHAIPASTVDSAGRFTFRGANFKIRDKLLPTGAREHWAIAG